MEEMRFPPSVTVAAGVMGQVLPLLSETLTVRVDEYWYEMPRIRQSPAPTGFGRLKRKSLPALPEIPIGFVEDAMCCTSVGVAELTTATSAVPREESAVLVAIKWNAPVVAGAE